MNSEFEHRIVKYRSGRYQVEFREKDSSSWHKNKKDFNSLEDAKAAIDYYLVDEIIEYPAKQKEEQS